MSTASYSPVARNLHASSPGAGSVAAVPGSHSLRMKAEESWRLRAPTCWLRLRHTVRRGEASCRICPRRAAWRSGHGDCGGAPWL
jgi:hypothetical protein